MYRNRKRMFFELPFLMIPIVLLAGLIVMFLWNAILPAATHASSINYWQATGLFILCRILFGGFRGRPGGNRPDMFRKGPGPAWREKWKNMTDEERVKFREEWKRRCARPGDQQ
jgi:hypothetical protein